MKNIILSERERDFLKSIIDYFRESHLTYGYTKTIKGYKFKYEEMDKLQDKLK